MTPKLSLTKVVRIMWVPVLLSAFYTCCVFLQRGTLLPQHPVQHVERDPLAAYGNSVRILHFYGPPEIAQGKKAVLCYNVVNAKAVRLDPPVERVWPAF